MIEASREWAPAITGSLAERANEAAWEVLVTLSQHPTLQRALRSFEEGTTFAKGRPWTRHDLPFGDMGLALACGYAHRLRPSAGWDIIGHALIEGAVTTLEQSVQNPSPGLLGGISGFGLAVSYLSLGGMRYSQLLHSIDDILLPLSERLLRSCVIQETIAPRLYDVVSGLVGVSRYFMTRRHVERAATFLQEALAHLDERASLPDAMGFFTAPEDMLEREQEDSQLAAGYINCGLAHGVSGPVAILALAADQLNEPALTRGLRSLGASLHSMRYRDQHGINWPSYVRPMHADYLPTRTAWCYGLPGVARSLLLAAKATGDCEMQESVSEALSEMAGRPLYSRNIAAPTLCHGSAGLLQVVLRFANEVSMDRFRPLAVSLVEEILSHFDSHSIVKFRDIESRGVLVENPGFLMGAIGTALSLLSATHGVVPDWDSALLLS